MTVAASPMLEPVGPVRLWTWPVVVVGGFVLGLVFGAPLYFVGRFVGEALFAPYGGHELARAAAEFLPLSLTLVGLALAGLIVAKAVYRRPMVSFVAPRPFRPGLMLAGFLGYLAVMGPVFYGVGQAAPEPGPLFDPTAPVDLKVAYVATMGLLILVAAAAEEALFRGLLLQMQAGTARLIPWLLFGPATLLFMAAHGTTQSHALVLYGALGAALAWAALRTGGLEASIGLHTAHNFGLMLFVGTVLDDLEKRSADPAFGSDVERVAGYAAALVPAVVVVLVTEVVARSLRSARATT